MPTEINTDKHGNAVHGHDVVAYFTDNQQTPGSPEFTHAWNGATWQFATAEHRDLFAAEPEKYAPQFGGYCALGRAMGVSVNGSPKRWRIENNQLYLNKNLMAQAMHGLFASRIRRLAAKR